MSKFEELLQSSVWCSFFNSEWTCQEGPVDLLSDWEDPNEALGKTQGLGASEKGKFKEDDP